MCIKKVTYPPGEREYVSKCDLPTRWEGMCIKVRPTHKVSGNMSCGWHSVRAVRFCQLLSDVGVQLTIWRQHPWRNIADVCRILPCSSLQCIKLCCWFLETKESYQNNPISNITTHPTAYTHRHTQTHTDTQTHTHTHTCLLYTSDAADES